MPSVVTTLIYPVQNLDSAKAVFGALLGAEPDIDTPYYVQFDIGGQRLGLDPNGHSRGFTGSVGYWEVEDVRATFDALIAAGATEHEAPKDVGNGALVASVKDPDGNIIGLIE